MKEEKKKARKLSQTRKASITEAISNIIPGFIINYFANIIFLPLFCFSISGELKSGDISGFMMTNVYIGITYTFVSLGRQYVLRRMFNKLGPNADFYNLSKRLYHKVNNKRKSRKK